VYYDSKIFISVNVKIECPCLYYEGTQGEAELLYSFYTWALNGDEWLTACPQCFFPTHWKRTPVPMEQRAGWILELI